MYHIGYFSNAARSANAFGYIPQSPGEIGTTFHLHTNTNTKHQKLLNPYVDLQSLTSMRFKGKTVCRKKFLFVMDFMA